MTATTNKPPTTPREVIEAMQELLAKKKAWAQYVFATDVYGFTTGVHSDNATCFCLSGARRRVIGPSPDTLINESGRTAMDLLDAAILMRSGSREGVVSFNDSIDTRHPHVREVLAIAEQFAVMHKGMERGEALPS